MLCALRLLFALEMLTVKCRKPTTFATLPGKSSQDPEKLIFALPGNPVSAIGMPSCVPIDVVYQEGLTRHQSHSTCLYCQVYEQ